MFSLAERLCTLSGHRCRPLCLWVIRRDANWRTMPSASFTHRELRARYDRGIAGLPFPPPAPTVVPPDDPQATDPATLDAFHERHVGGHPFTRKTA
jgi:hypothetical protein